MIAVAAAAAAAAACSKTPPPEPPAPVVPEAAPAPPPGPLLVPSTAAGVYQLRSELQGRGQPRRNTRNTRATSTLLLDTQPTAVPTMGAASGAQFNATIALPGLTHPPRGRSAQAAAWWPIPGDSVVVQFDTARDGVLIQLRGLVSGGTIQGEVWYVSLNNSATFQLGTFTATKQRARGR